MPEVVGEQQPHTYTHRETHTQRDTHTQAAWEALKLPC